MTPDTFYPSASATPPTTTPLTSALRAWLLTCPAVTAWTSRIYTLQFPQSLTAPAIRIVEIDRIGGMQLRGDERLQQSRIQVDSVEAPSHGDPYANVHALALAVRGDLKSGRPTGLVGVSGVLSGIPIARIAAIDQRELYDDTAQLLRIEQDYLVTWRL